MRISGVEWNAEIGGRSPSDRPARLRRPRRRPASIAAIASRDDRPVVTTSSTISTLRPGSRRKPRRRPNTPSGRSTNIAGFAQRAAHFVADDDPAHRRRDHRRRSPAYLCGQLCGQRAGQPLGPPGVHQHPRALQVARAAQARREDEMAFEQRLRGAELVEISSSVMRPPAFSGRVIGRGGAPSTLCELPEGAAA